VGKKGENRRRIKKTKEIKEEEIRLTSLHGVEIFFGSS
jgi:hypothetical protein